MKITISGADCGIHPVVLARLSECYPRVEWALLWSSSRVGSSRYPLPYWIEQVADQIPPSRLALHLCGRSTEEGVPSSIRLDWFGRIQLNRVVPTHDPPWLRPYTDRVIMQAASVQHLQQTPYMRALFDGSGGAGFLFDPDLAVQARESYPGQLGLAGGIGPSNIRQVVKFATKVGFDWVDMESGVRTNDRFNLELVEEVARES